MSTTLSPVHDDLARHTPQTRFGKPRPEPGDEAVHLSVIAPCLDEKDNVDELVTRVLSTLRQVNVSGELVIVDDGSSDDTWGLVSWWMGKTPAVRGVRHGKNLGIEAAWRSGLQAARGDLVCLIDSDLQNQPEDIARLYRTWCQNPDSLVQGSRRPINPPAGRYLFSKGLNLLLNLSFGMRLADNKSGFVLCRRSILDRVLNHRFEYRYYQCFIAVAAHAHGCPICEVDTMFLPRISGRSFLNNMPIRQAGHVFLEIIKARAEFRRHRQSRLQPVETRNPPVKPVPARSTDPC